MDELIEEELIRLCGPKGKHDPERGAKGHGARQAKVVLGGAQGQGPPTQGPDDRGRGGEAPHLGAVRIRGPAQGADRGDDARRTLDPALRDGARADRRARLFDLALGGLAPLRQGHPRAARRADSRPGSTAAVANCPGGSGRTAPAWTRTSTAPTSVDHIHRSTARARVGPLHLATTPQCPNAPHWGQLESPWWGR